MHRELFCFSVLSLSLSLGCGTAVQNYDDPNTIDVGGDTSGVDPNADTDGDGVFDVDEGAMDTNMNGVPAHLDPAELRLDGISDPERDTDADGTPDLTEGTVDANGNGLPAYRDPAEGGTAGPGDGGTVPMGDGGGNQPTLGASCTPTDSCMGAGGMAGCCESLTLTCGAMVGGECQTGVLCGGTTFCGGAGACCTTTGACGRLGSDSVTCEAAGGGGGDGGTTGGPMMVDSCPMVDGNAGCCADSGRCGLMDGLIGLVCLEPDDSSVTTPPPDLACTP